jgi:hypothetical protein
MHKRHTKCWYCDPHERGTSSNETGSAFEGCIRSRTSALTKLAALEREARRMGTDGDMDEKTNAEWEHERLFAFAMRSPNLVF